MILVLAAILLPTPVPEPAEAKEATLRAVRVTESPRVDGLLDEPVWASSAPAVGFRQREPREGEAATEATEVRILYDADSLYVGVLARDREPEKVIARVLQRDRLMSAGGDGAFRFAGDDAIALILDPFGDRRNAFVFATNANGAEFDALITDESPAFNADWRGVWRVAARKTSEGWSAEFAIPFRTLRYPSGDGAPSWGFNVERMIRRHDEDTLWSAWSRAEGGLHRVSRAGVLEGLQDLPRSRLNLELKPFGLGGMTQERGAPGSRAPALAEWRMGGDAKWELRPGLVLDATVRPDFAQVEADERVVNLTRFELFLPEKREFFLENAGIFDFGTRGSFETPPFLMFFSRRIGIHDGDEVPVLGGVRLSGRAGRQTVGFMSVLNDSAFGAPRTNFGAFRVKRDLGRSGYVGGMITDRRSSGNTNTDFGADASLWPTRRLNVQGFAARTSRSDGADDAAYRGAAEYLGDPVYLLAEYLQVGPRAQTGMGFVTRTDLRRSNGKAQYTLRPSLLGLRQVALFVGGKYVTRLSGETQDSNGFAGFSTVWRSGESLSVTEVSGRTVLDGGFPLAGRIPIQAGRYDLRDTEISFVTSAKRPLSFFGQASLLRIWDGHLYTTVGVLQARAGSRLSLSASYTRSDVSMPGGAFLAHVTGLRVGWTQSTRLTAAGYLQYDSLNRRFIGNFRLNFIHRPGSDLYLVFNEERGETADPWVLVNRGLAIKLTYLVRF
jgi:hypothetical protein